MDLVNEWEQHFNNPCILCCPHVPLLIVSALCVSAGVEHLEIQPKILSVIISIITFQVLMIKACTELSG